jgi:hypothetical protein
MINGTGKQPIKNEAASVTNYFTKIGPETVYRRCGQPIEGQRSSKTAVFLSPGPARKRNANVIAPQSIIAEGVPRFRLLSSFGGRRAGGRA